MLVKCEECSKFFGTEDENNKICSSCKEGEVTGLKHIKDPKEQRFIVARDIVYENPDVSPESLVKQMRGMGIGITIKEIMSYVRQGRLILKNAEVQHICEDCGKKILSGRKCPSCTKKFEDELLQTREMILGENEAPVAEEKDKKRKKGMHSQS